MSDNFLGLEALITERIRDEVPDLTVLGTAETSGMDEHQQTVPNAQVVLQGYKPTGNRSGAAFSFEQTWHVYVCVRNVGVGGAEGIREEAGPFLSKILGALLHWKPSSDAAPLLPAPTPLVLYRPGFAYFPLAFTTRVVERGTP